MKRFSGILIMSNREILITSSPRGLQRPGAGLQKDNEHSLGQVKGKKKRNLLLNT